MGSIQYLKIQPIPVSLSYLRYIFRHFYKVNVSEVSTDIEEISWTMRRNCMNHATLAAARERQQPIKKGPQTFLDDCRDTEDIALHVSVSEWL